MKKLLAITILFSLAGCSTTPEAPSKPATPAKAPEMTQAQKDQAAIEAFEANQVRLFSHPVSN